MDRLVLGPAMAAPVRPSNDPLAAIRRRFLEMVEGYVLDVALHRREAETPAQLRPALAGIAMIAHRVSGVAATLGHEGLGETAAALDQKLTQALKNGPLNLREFDGMIVLFHSALSNTLDEAAT